MDGKGVQIKYIYLTHYGYHEITEQFKVIQKL